MQCDKCNKTYKTQKTLDNHIIKMHPKDDVLTDLPTQSSQTSQLYEPTETTEEVHQCDTCNKCKDEIKYYMKLTDILYKRNKKLEEQVNILMTDFLKNKYIEDHNKENPTEQITEEEFDEMYTVIYPYVIPKEWHTDIINGLDAVLNEIYKDKITDIDKKELINLVKQKIKI